MRREQARAALLPAVILAFVAASCAARDDVDLPDGFLDVDADGPDGPCTAGATRCMDGVFEECVGGEWTLETDCVTLGLLCDPDLGCVECAPGRFSCEGDVSMICDPDGMGWSVSEDCSLTPGEFCDPLSGVCINECERAALERSNVGCEYWAVDLDQAVFATQEAASQQFAVVVANVSDIWDAEVTVYWDTTPYGTAVSEEPVPGMSAVVGPDETYVFRLPRYDVDGIDAALSHDDGPQTALSKKAFRVESSLPVVAYQFNTLNQDFSTDASLLIPTTALGRAYDVVGWEPYYSVAYPVLGIPTPNRGYVTIVGTTDGTDVSVIPSDDIEGSVGTVPADYGAVGPIAAGVEATFVLNRYDVLNLESISRAMPKPDLTGTIVSASSPVAVFTGTDMTIVAPEVPPWCTEGCNCCGDHLEDQVIPRSAMGTEYVVSHSAWRTTTGSWIEYDYYKVLAVVPDTHVTTTLTDVGSFNLGADEVMEFGARSGFALWSTEPVHVVQVLASMDQTEERIGDPSLIHFPAVEQRRSKYVFTTGEGFAENWAVVSMPEDATATIDGADVGASCDWDLDGELMGITYRSYYCPISAGTHVVDGAGEPVGLTVYGYFEAGSYGFPGGSDLREIFFG